LQANRDWRAIEHVNASRRQPSHRNSSAGSGSLLCVCLLYAALLVIIAPARAADIKPAVVYDLGGKFDKSFNEAAYLGAERFKRETGIAYSEFEITNESQREQALRSLARRGATILIAVGFDQRSAVETVAPDFPNAHFVLIDEAASPAPNVQSVKFREEEGSFLVGMLAADASPAKRIGFIGGMDIPLIHKFACGYLQGARHESPGIAYIENMTGTTPAAWNDPARAAELARSQFDRGVDVVFVAAGATNLGVLQAAKDAGKLAIGADANQNGIQPGSVLTSMVKHVDVAVYRALKAERDGSFHPGLQTLGLREDGVDWALDDFNRPLISPEMRQRVDRAKAEIAAGSLAVADYTKTGSCPVP
jgi:basic membrane protein A